jgi:hypothetical protein
MCTKFDEIETKKLREQNEVITCYKIYRLYFINEEYVLQPLWANISHSHTEYIKPGVTKSDRSSIRFPNINDNDSDYFYEYDNYYRIGKGIHVYRDIEAAICEYKTYCSDIIVKVICKTKDLIGANKREAVFMEIELTEEEYNKAIEQRKKDDNFIK